MKYLDEVTTIPFFCNAKADCSILLFQLSRDTKVYFPEELGFLIADDVFSLSSHTV